MQECICHMVSCHVYCTLLLFSANQPQSVRKEMMGMCSPKTLCVHTKMGISKNFYMSQNSVYFFRFFFFSQPVKHMETTLLYQSWDIQKQPASWVWPTGHHLPTPENGMFSNLALYEDHLGCLLKIQIYQGRGETQDTCTSTNHPTELSLAWWQVPRSLGQDGVSQCVVWNHQPQFREVILEVVQQSNYGNSSHSLTPCFSF